MTQQEARHLAGRLWGIYARVIGEDDVASTVDVPIRRVGVQYPDPTIRSFHTFEEYGRGRTWEEAFADAEVRLEGRD